jgi:hypothetical protein
MIDSAATKTGEAEPSAGAARMPARGLSAVWRAPAPVAAALDLTAPGLFNVQTWVDHAFWRPAAFWAGIAGALAMGVGLQSLDWRTLALALILADLLWGGVWRLAGGRTRLLPLSPHALRQDVWLPYLQPGSPAARVFATDHQDLWPLALRVGAPAIVLALLVAAVLGVEAVVLTLIVVALTVLGWTARHTLRGIPIVLASLVSIGLPWLLIMQQVAPPGEAAAWDAVVWSAPALLAGLWVIHHWGETRTLAAGRDLLTLLLLAAGELGLCGLLIVAQAPLWLAGVVPLLLPAWLMIVQGRPVGRRMQPLWLLAMLLSALALGQPR